jgi:hypothetical protein
MYDSKKILSSDLIMSLSSRRVHLLLFNLFVSACLAAQSNSTGSWNVINTKVHFGNNNGFIFFEGVLRTQKLTTDFFYHDLKAGFVYNPSDKIGFHFGVGDFATYNAEGNFKSPVQNEVRMWEQLQLNSRISVVRLEHRYRIEQRFFNTGYRNRFRYRLNTITPILKSKTKPRALNILLYDEVFLTDTNPIFEKNRWFAGVTYSMGWIHDFDLRRNGTTTTKNFVQTSLLFDIYAPHHERKTHPESVN